MRLLSSTDTERYKGNGTPTKDSIEKQTISENNNLWNCYKKYRTSWDLLKFLIGIGLFSRYFKRWEGWRTFHFYYQTM